MTVQNKIDTASFLIFRVAIYNFNHMKNVVLIILINQGKIAIFGTFIGKHPIGDGDTFAYPIATVGFGDGNCGFIMIS
jgi:hypothetical protein